MNRLLILAMACALLAACSSTVKKAEEAAPPNPQPAATTVAPSPAKATPVVPSESEAIKLARMSADLMKKSVYFDYDKYIVKPEFQNMLMEQAAFLKKASNDTLVLQGNADERGSSEYNLALGQKRAEAVRKMLLLLGVDDNRMEAVSFGKEKPRETCHEERCWQENRRVDFVHKLK